MALKLDHVVISPPVDIFDKVYVLVASVDRPIQASNSSLAILFAVSHKYTSI